MSGDYVSFVDSDDWLARDFVAHLLGLILDRPGAIAVAHFMKVPSDRASQERGEAIHRLSRTEALLASAHLSAATTVFIVVWGKLYPRSLFSEVEFPMGRIHEDEFTTYRLLGLATEVLVTSAPLYYYQQRADGITGKGFSLRGGLDLIDALLQRADYFDQIGMVEARDRTNLRLLYAYVMLFRHMDAADSRFAWRSHAEEMKQRLSGAQFAHHPLSARVGFQLYANFPKCMNRVSGLRARILRGLPRRYGVTD